MADAGPAGARADRPAAIRDAATLILLRRTPAGPAVLMGMRGATAAFMPEKFVFPGGAVDAGDRSVPLAGALEPITERRLADGIPDPGLPRALAAAAIRELWEEAGLALGRPGPWPDPPRDWAGFAASAAQGARSEKRLAAAPQAGDDGADPERDAPGSATTIRPAAGALRFVFRAVTPAGRPRRFDARFFTAPAEALLGDPDDFSRASDELSHLQWVPLAQARRFNLPFITEVVLSEVARLWGTQTAPDSVPFFDNSGPRPVFRRIA